MADSVPGRPLLVGVLAEGDYEPAASPGCCPSLVPVRSPTGAHGCCLHKTVPGGDVLAAVPRTRTVTGVTTAQAGHGTA